MHCSFLFAYVLCPPLFVPFIQSLKAQRSTKLQSSETLRYVLRVSEGNKSTACFAPARIFAFTWRLHLVCVCYPRMSLGCHITYSGFTVVIRICHVSKPYIVCILLGVIWVTVCFPSSDAMESAFCIVARRCYRHYTTPCDINRDSTRSVI